MNQILHDQDGSEESRSFTASSRGYEHDGLFRKSLDPAVHLEGSRARWPLWYAFLGNFARNGSAYRCRP